MADNNQESEQEKRKKAAKTSIKEGSATSMMEGFGIRYITPYALLVGANNFQVGLLASLPSLLGHIIQIPFLRLMKHYSRKKIVFSCVLLQALLWLPIISIAIMYFFFGLSSQAASNILIIVYSLMTVAGNVGSPAWNSWMRDLVSEHSGEYFGTRNKFTNLSLVISMLIAGLILNIFDQELAYVGFLIVFSLALIGRSISAFFLTRQYEPEYKYDPGSYFSFYQFVKKMLYNNFGHFVLLVSMVSFATAIAGPFFAVYMLKDLGFSYMFFTLVTLSHIVAIILFMPFWGKFADKFGNLKVLKITGHLIPILPLLWLLTIPLVKLGNPYFILVFLMLLEATSGFLWSGFNLCAVNFIYEAVTKQRMAICVAYFNLLNAFGTFVGAMIGGAIVSRYDYIFNIRSLFVIFVLSSVVRMFFVLIISPRIQEVRKVEDFDLPKHLKTRIKKNFAKIETIVKDNFLRHIGYHPIGRTASV